VGNGYAGIFLLFFRLNSSSDFSLSQGANHSYFNPHLLYRVFFPHLPGILRKKQAPESSHKKVSKKHK